MATENYSLVSDFEMRGFWWLPDNPNKRVSGTLKFKQTEGTSLELDGTLYEPDQFASKVFSPPIVLGSTHDGKDCTLALTLRSSHSICSSGTETSIIDAEYLFIGKHFSKLDDILFKSVKVGYTYLEEWLSHQPFHQEHKNLTKRISEIQMRYRMPPQHRVKVPPINATFTFMSSVQSDNSGSGIRFLHADAIGIRPKGKKPFKWYWTITVDLQNLMTLLIWEPVFPIQMSGYTRRLKLNRDLYVNEEVQIFFPQKNFRRKKSVLWPFMLFPYKEVKESLCRIIPAWYSRKQELSPVYNLFFGNIYQPSAFHEYRFLSLTQALEAFHRAKGTDKYVSESAYDGYAKKMLAAVPNDAPSDLKDSLKQRIKYGNEYALRKRLLLLFQSLSDSAKDVAAKNYKDFVNNVVDTRNYLTHHDPSAEGNVFKGDVLHKATMSLQKLLLILLFKDIGIPEDTAVERISKNNKFQCFYVNWESAPVLPSPKQNEAIDA